MAVYKSSEGYNGIVRPILADIDGREDEATHDGVLYEQELIRARDLTLKVVNQYLKEGTPEQDIRVYFSGTRVFMLN